MNHKLQSLTLRLWVLVFSAWLAHGALAQDLAAIRASGVLRHLGIPYANFVTGSGDGFDVEMVQMFAAELGLRYEFVPTDWDNVLADLIGRQIRFKPEVRVAGSRPVRGDIVATGLTVLPPRKKLIDYSAPTFPSAVWLIARADFAAQPVVPSGDPSRDTAATRRLMALGSTLVVDNTCLDPTLYDVADKGYPLKRLASSTVLSVNNFIPAVLNGESDMTLLDVPDIMIALEKWPGRIKVLGPISDRQHMAAGFRKDAPELRAAFNAFLVRIKADGRYMRLVEKYYPAAPGYLPHFFAQLPTAH